MKFLLPLILLPVFALAQSATVPKATLLTLSDSINQEFLTPQALFREEKSLISATFLVKPGEKPDLVANLYLDGGDLGAPLAKDIPLQINAKSTNPALLEGNFNFTFPPVKKPTLFRILVTEKGQTGKSAACASFAVRLYPKDWFAITVRKITEHSAPEIVIFGKLPGL
ncbi:MAG: hypothetical protein ABIP97_04000, partial [Chthoniobacterales bacterium]